MCFEHLYELLKFKCQLLKACPFFNLWNCSLAFNHDWSWHVILHSETSQWLRYYP